MMEHKPNATRLARWYRSIAHGLFYFLTFSLPLFALPWTVDTLELNKQTLLIATTSVAAIVWLGAMVVERRTTFRPHALWWVLLGFFVTTCISGAMSLAPFTSWVGQAQQQYTSVMTLAGFLAMLVIGAHALSSTRVQQRIWSSLILSGTIVSLLTFVQLFGWSSVSVVGTSFATGLFLAVVTVLGMSLWMVAGRKNGTRIFPQGVLGTATRFALSILIGTSIVSLLAFDFWLYWVILGVGCVAIFVFLLLRREAFPHPKRMILPVVIFALSLLFFFFPSPLPNVFGSELAISYGLSWEVAGSAIAESPLFGSGPGTFAIDYSQFHEGQLNETVVWNERFNRSSSHVLTLLATYGIVPVVFYAILILWLAGMSLARLWQAKQPTDEWDMTFVTFGSWVAVILGQLFYVQNMTLAYVFWLLTAILISQVVLKERSYPFSSSPRSSLLTIFAFVFANVLLLTLLFVTGTRYISEIAYAKALYASQQGAETDEIIAYLSTAATQNKWSDVYQRNLAQAYLIKTAALTENEDVHPSAIQDAVERSIQAAERATEISPNDVVNWGLKGDVYREVIPLVSGADVRAIESYKTATELAPAQPLYQVALARAYIARADQLSILAGSDDQEFADQAQQERQEMLALAIAALEEAVALKQDYTTAYYYLALTYERSGNISKAIERMTVLRDAQPYDVGIAMQLGLLYLRQGKVNEAQTELERAVGLDPGYANARWYLAAVYAELDAYEDAIEQLNEILETNPDNETVLREIQRLESALSPPEEVPEPLEESE